jgi:BlaI family penicillinase repressor
MNSTQEITESEFPIMKILWEKHELSIREVHDLLLESKDWAYSTTKTTMDRMVKKGLLERHSRHHVFLYRPLISKAQGMLKWVRFFADGFLSGSPQDVVAMFTQSGSLTQSEADELQNLLKDDQA